ncbi:ROK family transcriptional regulator [Nocardiopsis chromatogenes]|uniref:ROK family transcriptional regulator n=1 Tax=Nocardiopsis chromatogenes TaxID=280239 RepID=UPI00034B1EE5|nr:ROK family transcriptional regulator [Nocardiopsis chromatogenes]
MPRRHGPPATAATAGHVLRLIRTGEAATRAEIARVTRLSRPSVASRVAELMDLGLVTEGHHGPSSGGRPPGRLEFDADGGVVLSAALGISRSQAAVCDLAGRVLARTEGSPEVAQGPDTALPWLLGTWERLLAECGRAGHEARGVGIGLPGTVRFALGRAEEPPVLPGWGGVDIAPLVAERFPVPVLLDNDVNVMALGSHTADYPDADDLVFVKVSTGVGAGIISGGALVRGTLGAAGEVGHIPVPDGGGTACRCGNTDCLEAVAGGPALLARFAEGGREAAGVQGLAALASDGDADAVALVREAGRRVGEVLAGAVNLLNPEVIVLGGHLGTAFDPLAAGVREAVFRRATALATRQLRIVPNRSGGEAGLRGAAAMVLDHILAPEAVNTAIAEREAAAAANEAPAAAGSRADAGTGAGRG